MLVYIFVLIFRVINALTIQTTYNPDEYWQSLEVAYKIVNGFGYLTWEWEPCISLRSVMHPLVFAVCYKFIINPILFLFGNRSYYTYFIPRMYQSIFAAMTDIGTSKLAYLVLRNQNNLLSLSNEKKSDASIEDLGHTYGLINRLDHVRMDLVTLLLSISSWYYFFTLCRTYSQCIECCFNVWSAYYIYKSICGFDNICSHNGSGSSTDYLYKKNVTLGVMFSALSVLIRSSSLQFWLYFYFIFIIERLMYARNNPLYMNKIVSLITICLIVAAISAFMMVITDVWFYGKLTIPMINFIRFNLIGDPGKYYGKQSVLYFFIETPLLTLLSYIHLFLFGAYISLRNALIYKNRVFTIFQLSTFLMSVTLSIASHKEHRFIIPYFPFIIITTSIGFHNLLGLKSRKHDIHLNKMNIPRVFDITWLKYLLIIQIIPALFFTTLHQRGGENIIRYFSKKSNLSEINDSIFFISQCHMYPIYSYLNKQVPIGFLDCSPSINGEYDNWNQLLWKHENTSELLEQLFIENHKDVSCTSPYVSRHNIIHNDELDFKNCLDYRFKKNLCPKLPTYFVVHSYFNNRILEWLNAHNYKLKHRIFDSFITETPIGNVLWSYYYIYSVHEN